MPSTARGYPYPSSSDLVTNGAAAIQSLAEAIETRAIKFTANTFSGTTNASGDLTLTHGLGSTPSVVIVSPGTTGNGSVDALAMYKISAKNGTTVTLRMYRNDTHVAFASNPFALHALFLA